LLFISLFALVVQADDFVPEDEEQTAADVFILGSTDSGSNITLQFGSVLGEFLQWDAANGRFSLSGDLDLAASQLVNTRLENLPTAPTCDGAAAGRVYFDTTSSSAFVCDGTTWIDLGGQSAASATQDLATARYRDTSTTNLNATATDNIVPWNTEDFENPKFTHDEVTNNSQIQVTDSGKYLVSGSVNVINTSTNNFRYNGRLKFRINGITTLPQTFQPGYIRRNYWG